MQAYFYHWDDDKNISFESDLYHCSSCTADEDDGYRSPMDLGCCCIHQQEAERIGLASRKGINHG